jgi:hypothetical protein
MREIRHFAQSCSQLIVCAGLRGGPASCKEAATAVYRIELDGGPDAK